jgi:NitT/TauT family transport system substrate-binding protein
MPMIRLLAALVCSTALLLSAAVAQTPEKDKVTVSIGTWVVGYLPLPIAKIKGYFKDSGVDVSIQNFDAGGSKALQALVGGSTDLVVGFYDHTLHMQTQGKNVRCLVLLNVVPGFVVAVRKDLAGEIKSIKDFKGRKVGVTALGSSTEFMLRNLINKNGLTPRDVTAVAVGSGPTSVAAVERKSIDITIAPDPAATILQKRNLIDIMIDARTPEGTAEVFGGPYPTTCLYAMEDFITKNPVTVQRLVTAFVRTLDWMSQSTAAQIVDVLTLEYIIGDKAEFVQMVDKSLPMFPKTGKFNLPDLERVRDVLGSFNEKVKNFKIDMEKTYTNRFVEAAKK